MKEKINQKGFIPIIFIIIGAVVVASATFGVIKYKDELTANISKVFEPQIKTSDTELTGGDEIIEETGSVGETESVEEPIIEEKSETEEKQDNTQELQEQLRIAEQKRLEAEKQLAEEKAKQEIEEAKAEAEEAKAGAEKLRQEMEETKRKAAEQEALRKAEEEALRKAEEEARIKAEQELQRQLEAQRLAEEQQKQEELARKQKVSQVLEQLTVIVDGIDSQLAILDNQIKEKEAEIESIKKNPWLTQASMEARIAKVISELNPLIDQWNSLLDTRNKIITISYKLDDYANYGIPLSAEDRTFLSSLGISF